MTTSAKSVSSFVSFGCPVCAIAIAVISGRATADEDLGMRIIGIGGLCCLLLALVALICAFARKEKLRWFTILPLLIIVGMFTLGVPSTSVSP
jgi:hypothetical protein